MRAIVQDTYGGTEVLELREIDKPAPADNEVLVRVEAAGFEPGVWHVMTGQPYLIRLMGYGLRRPKIGVLGTDFAGHVEAMGKGVTDLQPGDAVFGGGKGSFAEFVCAEAKNVAAKPANLNFEQAAAVPVSGLTALQGLRAGGALEPGRKVLVIGAAGGVGSFAVQIAKAFGGEVTGVCSTTKVDLVRSLGVDHVIDYKKDDFAERPERYDLILDTAGNRSLGRLRRALAPKGCLVFIGGEEGGRWFMGLGRNLRAALMSPFVGQNLRTLFAAGNKEDLLTLQELAEAGKIVPLMDRTFPLADAPAAIQYWEDRKARGKLVIEVASGLSAPDLATPADR